MFSGKQDDDLSVISSPTFSLVTSLMYHYFNEQDIESEDDSNAETYTLIKNWEDINSKLLRLHAERLRDTAEALGRKDFAERLGAAFDGAGGHQIPNDHALDQSKTYSTHIDLGVLIEQAARRHAIGAEIAPPVRRTMRSHKLRVLILPNDTVHVELAENSATSEVTRQLSSIVKSFTANPFTKDIQGLPTSLVTMDTKGTRSSLFTRHKTTHRAPYDEARSRAQLSPTALPTKREMLLFNDNDEIMEASLSSVYFHREERWVTPSAECGGMQSVTKMYALEQEWCIEGVVRRESVMDGETVWLGNAVRGFFPGEVSVSFDAPADALANETSGT